MTKQIRVLLDITVQRHNRFSIFVLWPLLCIFVFCTWFLTMIVSYIVGYLSSVNRMFRWLYFGRDCNLEVGCLYAQIS